MKRYCCEEYNAAVVLNDYGSVHPTDKELYDMDGAVLW